MQTIKAFYNPKNITRPFGYRDPLYTIIPGKHAGTDYGRTSGDDIPALLPGRVVRVRRTQQMAWIVVFRDSAGRYHQHSHLAKDRLPVEGSLIEQGARVGRKAKGSRNPLSIEWGGTAWNGKHDHYVISDKPDGGYLLNQGATFFDPAKIVQEVLNPPTPARSDRFTLKQVALTDLNLRSTPSTGAKVILTLKRGWDFDTGTRKGDFEHVRTVRNGTEYIGYAHRDYMVAVNRKVTTKGGVKLNLRATPSTRGKVLGQLPNGRAVKILGADGPTDSSKWRKVKVRVGVKTLTGWVASEYLK